MSITTALSNAVSGLAVTSRAAELVSNNVSNAMTEGYGRRKLELGPRALGNGTAGVRVTGITRDVDAFTIRDRRLADASVGQGSVRTAFFNRVGQLAGLADDPSSLSGRVRALETALASAASRPDATVRLQGVLDSASSVVRKVNEISNGIQTERAAADASIARQVEDLNGALRRMEVLNSEILRLNPIERNGSALLDERQVLIDSIASIVPLREYARPNGTVALYTATGAMLVDGRAATLSFNRTPFITADMTLASGALSGIAINGQPVRTTGAFSPIAGGSLAAAFSVRDELAVTAQERIDGFARDLIERFQSPAVDPTLAPTDPGLFTDGAVAFDPANATGLAGRLSINALVDPARGGELWRLRTGIGAAAPGPVGDATLLNNLAAAVSANRLPASAALPALANSLPGLSAEFQSLSARDGLTAETDLGFARARQDTLAAVEKRGGVDTDDELQKLLLIERTYAANARVIETIDRLIGRLLEF